MNYNIIPVEKFRKEAKRLIKKYPSLQNELIELNRELSLNPLTGISLGNSIFKIRLLIRSKKKGKSGGARVITYVVTENKEVYLLAIYDKSDIDSVDNKLLKEIVASLKID